MRILVTGSEGTVGVPLVRALELKGHQVFRCDLLHGDDSNYRRADISQYRQAQAAVEWSEPDVVFHLAAEFGRANGEDFYEQLWMTNVVGTKHLIDLVPHNVPFVFFSTSEVYGKLGDRFQAKLVERYTEEHPIEYPNSYAVSKRVSEIDLRNSGRSYMILRPFNAYGPGERPNRYRSVITSFTRSVLKKSKVVVYRDCFRSFLYVDDLVRTVSGIPSNYQPGESFNLGGLAYLSMEDLFGRICKEAGSSVEYELKDPPKTETRHKRPCLEKSRKVLRHEERIDLSLGIANTVCWMREHLNV